MARKLEYLTQEQIDHFLEFGYIVIKKAFTKEKAEEWTKDLWVRLNLDPHDKSTWDRERIHMPSLHREKVATFAPTAWAAIKDLLGGEERINEVASTWEIPSLSISVSITGRRQLKGLPLRTSTIGTSTETSSSITLTLPNKHCW
ncbi:unnamed protein product [Cyclocybe aegerita]|uniref:Uncharacterized protein n=1 Tax=Cyclocybe aegerita TaxID=1973307 RepID=A0A8S0W184_CYCAE|nr:unnamed protein product [Cyclocybe aegerita]